MIKELVKNILFYLKKNNHNFSPIFIIGCGRSGTTILGKTLSEHPDIKYLNEPRRLWHKVYPEFNIWEENISNPVLFADEKNTDSIRTNQLQKLFFREQVLSNSKVVLEKLPINNFRLKFLKKSFPKAKFIYLTRNGLEVSKSIERRIQKQNWFIGKKYELLKEYEQKTSSEYNPKTDLEKGMWEWKLSIMESDNFFKNLKKSQYIHLSYQDFIENPEKKTQDIFNFLNLNSSEGLVKNISGTIQRKNPKQETIETENLKEIGGELLNESISNTYSPF